MLVLPPPPRYIAPTTTSQTLVDTHNTLEHPTGTELNLVAGEGTYTLRDELHLATPPPHPSEPLVQNLNPLATTILPPSTGTKLSLAVLATKHRSLYGHARTETPTSEASDPRSSRGSHADVQQARISQTGSAFGNTAISDRESPFVIPFGQSNPALAPVLTGKEAKDPTKKRKPKSNIVKSNSSFVSRVVAHELLSKRLQDRQANGIFAFANVNRALLWLDLSSTFKVENLTKILFTKAHALCHDVNHSTISSTHIDIIMGFSTGDIIWYESMSQKYTRINKNGMINTTPVSEIRWMPGSDNLFLAAHFDGSLVVYDKEKEDAPFVEEGPSGESTDPSISKNPMLQIRKSVQSRSQKTNPVSVWKISNSRINSFSFSPDGRYLATVSEDGCLRLIDVHQEKLLDVSMSYYGGMLSVCWSPDSRYILTGGQDDLVSIWSLMDSTLIARCQGHNSWVTAVAFDPWRCDERNYRFGSVGEDGRLLLWDFNIGSLHRPRAASIRQRASVASAVPHFRLRSESNLSNLSVDADDIVHPVQPRARTAILPPVMAKSVDTHPLCWLAFEEDCIITSCSNGHIKTWDRPSDNNVAASQRAIPSSLGNGVMGVKAS